MIIGFHSKGYGAGKDTAAKMVSDWCLERAIPYRRVAMADKMKLLVAATLGIEASSEQEAIDKVDAFKLNGTYSWSITNDPRKFPYAGNGTGRDFIINLAGDSANTGARGLFGDSFWVDQALPLDGNYEGVVAVTDVRFQPEVNRIHQLGGVVVEIRGRGRNAGGRSEQGVEGVDYTVENAGTLVELRAYIRALMDLLESTEQDQGGDTTNYDSEQAEYIEPGPTGYSRMADRMAAVSPLNGPLDKQLVAMMGAELKRQDDTELLRIFKENDVPLHYEAIQRIVGSRTPQKPLLLVLSGPMGGLPEQNVPAFFEAEKRLKTAGYRVINPAHLCTPEILREANRAGNAFGQTDTYWNLVEKCLTLMATMDPDGVAHLPGWTHSNGARAEHRMATHLGLTCAPIQDWLAWGAHTLWTGHGKEPTKHYEGDAGLDLTCTQDTIVRYGEFADIPCGVSIALPTGMWGLITGRSSTLRNRKLLVNQGIIDNGYRGELFAGVWNLGDKTQTVKKGERIAQLIPMTQHTYGMKLAHTDQLPGSDRHLNGFGSTGT